MANKHKEANSKTATRGYITGCNGCERVLERDRWKGVQVKSVSTTSPPATVLGSEKFLFTVWSKYKWSVYWLVFMDELFYQVLKNRIKWSRGRWRHVTLKRQTRDPNMLWVHYLENNWRCYLASITNYLIVCCEAVRSAILATVWLFLALNMRSK